LEKNNSGNSAEVSYGVRASIYRKFNIAS